MAARLAALPPDQIASTLRLFFESDDVFEVRALDHGGPGKKSASWFKGSMIPFAAEKIAEAAKVASGVYFTPNPTSPDCLRRGTGKLRPAFFPLTAAKDVPARRWLIIDVDPIRPAGFKKDSATDAEKLAAAEVAGRVRTFLATKRWPAPLVMDSGNGVHLYYRLPERLAGGPVDDPATDLLATLLACLKARFDTQAAEIDGKVYDASRIMKVPGTASLKGPGTDARPHRLSGLLTPADGSADAAPHGEAATIAELIAELDPDGTVRNRDRAEPSPNTSRGPVGSARSSGDIVLPPVAVRIDRARKWLLDPKTPVAVEGSNGSRVTFVAALTLFHGFALDEDDTFNLLQADHNPRCQPKWSDKELWHKVRSAAGKQPKKPYGWKYENDRRQAPRAVIGRPPEPAAAPSEAGHPAPGATVATEKAPRWEILQYPAELRDVVAQSIAALVAMNDPPILFTQGDALVRLDPAALQKPVKPLSKSQLRLTLSDAATYITETEMKGGEVKQKPVFPRPEVVESVQDHPGGWRGIPGLKSVVNVPVITAESGLLTRPGYDHASGVYLLPVGHHIVDPVPERPTGDDIAKAKSLLLDHLLVDFPFVDKASRANTLSMFLVPFVRPLIQGPTPLYHIDAPQEGTGKSLLAETWGAVALGGPLPSFGEVTRPDDWQKLILSAVMESPQVIFLDNLSQTLDSPTLASALTSPAISGRLLGFSRIVTAEVWNMWISSGNNVAMSRELVRRTVFSRIQANQQHAYQKRTFKYQLPTWAFQNRGKLVWACLVLCQAWVASGKPAGRQLLGKFEGWSAVVDGILQNAGIEDLLGNMDAFREGAADDQDDWDAFVAAWWDSYRGAWVTVRDLFPLAQGNDMLGNVRGDGNDDSQRKRLGRAIKRHRDAVFAEGFQIIAPDRSQQHKSSNRVANYRLVKAGERGDLELDLPTEEVPD